MSKKVEFYRMLKPYEVRKIIEVIPKPEYQMSFKTAVYTGMRYKELRLFAEHKEWFNYKRKIIIIPKKFTKTKSERKINLTPAFAELLYYFLQKNNLVYPQAYQSWTDDLRRWAKNAGIENYMDLSAGTTRKTWESWLIESGHTISKILASQGHNFNTSCQHYYNNDVTPEEREEMKKETAGWM